MSEAISTTTTTATPSAEPPKPPAPPEIPPEVVQREKAVRAEQQKLAKEREEFAASRAEYERWKAEQAKAKSDTLDPLEQLKETRSQVEQLRESHRKAEEERTRREWASAQIDKVKSSPDRYELTLLHGYETLVPARIEQHYRATGEMLSAEAAADLVEKDLEAAVEKSLKSKRWASKAAPPPPPAQTGEPSGRDAPRTIAGLTGTSTAPPPKKPALSFEERKRVALEKTEAFIKSRQK